MNTISRPAFICQQLMTQTAGIGNLAKSMTILATLVPTLTSPSYALTLITERDALEGNDLLNWSSLEKVFDPFNPNPDDFLANSFSAKSSRGLGVEVDIMETLLPPFITPPFVFQSSVPPIGIPTNFAPGDFILLTGLDSTSQMPPTPGNPGPLTLIFNSPVKGVGTQVAVDDATAPYTVFLSAFDQENNLLANFSVMGTSSTDLDNSAVFLGVLSETPNIAKVIYSSSVPARAFGINNLSLISSVPEPNLTFGFFALSTIITLSTFKGKLKSSTSVKKDTTKAD